MARRAERMGLLILAIASGAFEARAQMAERFAVDQRGDFILIGNTLAQDCALSAPLLGEVGACGANADDTGSDVLWSVPEDGSDPIASTAVEPADAASIAVLTLPPGASVTRAELFWSAQAGQGDSSRARLARGDAALTVSAERTSGSVADDHDYYQSSADVTAFVRELGAGAYRLSDIDAADPVGLDDIAYYAGWWLVVFYALDSEPVRHLGLYDGLALVDVDAPIGATLGGFEVPSSGIDGKLGIIGFDGDGDVDGDQLRFGPSAPVDTDHLLDDSNNFFDGSRRGTSGEPLSSSGDRPRLRGDSGSMSGVDLHVVDVGAALAPGQAAAEVLATTTSDRFFLSGLVLAVTTTFPDLTRSTESVRDVDGPPLRPGDELQYSVHVDNTGSRAAAAVTLSAALPPQVSYVAGSLAVSGCANAGAATDEADADWGELDRSSGETVIARLGEGASSSTGGRLDAGQSCDLTYRVVLNADASGSIVSQALVGIESEGGAGGDVVTPTDSDLEAPGVTPTQISIDVCALDADCGGGRCDDRTSPPRCVTCLADADCSGLTPSCTPTGACVCVPSGPELRCDGKDDDCDGLIDEDLVGVACQVGEGACRAAGVTVCAADGGVLCQVSPDAKLPDGCGGPADACGADPLDCATAAGVGATASSELPASIDSGVALPSESAAPPGVAAPPDIDPIEPSQVSVAPYETSAATLGGGGGCSLTSRSSPRGPRELAPWLLVGASVGSALRRRRARRPR